VGETDERRAAVEGEDQTTFEADWKKGTDWDKAVWIKAKEVWRGSG
jgi:hypothetical protein